MKKYIAFLRGINVSGQKKIKMAELRESLKKAGFESIETYIQSGNLVIETEQLVRHGLSRKIEEVIESKFSFEVPVLTTTAKELKDILGSNPFLNSAEEKNLYFCLLYDIPQTGIISNLNPSDYPNEDFLITDRCVYLNCRLGAGKAKLNNNIIERKLKVTATTRNLKTMKKMLELAG